MSEQKSKLQQLRALEKPDFLYERNVDDNKTPLLITFPYPYMNGKLHLGHLFTLSKAEFYARYKELEGYNVLFPFAFHCTGMPISASAKKLSEELNGEPVDNSIKKILQSLGFNNFKKFTDPIHWIKTFPRIAIDTLTEFELMADWRRSFITTEYNLYYDSFVKWQFEVLKEKGYLFFGKRYSIYCPKDEQPCFDHDRMKGEGVEPIALDLLKIPLSPVDSEKLFTKLSISAPLREPELGDIQKDMLNLTYLLAPLVKHNLEDKIEVLVTKNYKFQRIKLNKKFYLIDSKLKENIKRQFEIEIIGEPLELEAYLNIYELPDNFTLKLIESETPKFLLKNTKKYENNIINDRTREDNNDGETLLRIYIPESEVISRSGAVCVVSLTDQWFINYGDSEWKQKTRTLLEKLQATKQTKDMLIEGIDWIEKWGFSRSFGLGTRIPWDEKYLIDSLSDSSIYMAFYTVKHFLFKDIEGKEEIFPTKHLCKEMWDFIFYGKETQNKELKRGENYKILEKARKSFLYFYPVDLRVSGKDLLKNHLLFFLFNHVAIFDESFFPKRIFTNGYLLLNSEKMSKSTGNFLTVEKCISKYGVHATRLCLASCGDFNEDANFEENVANQCIIKLCKLKDSIEAYAVSEKTEETQILKDFLLGGISLLAKQTICNYEKMLFKEVVKTGFYEMLNLYNLFIEMGGTDNSVSLYMFFRTILILMEPIVCSFSISLLNGDYLSSKLDSGKNNNLCTESSNNKFKTINLEHKTDIYEGVTYYLKQIKLIKKNAVKKKIKKIRINLGKEYSEWKKEVLNSEEEKYAEIFQTHRISPKVGLAFANFKEKKTFDEFAILTEFRSYFEKISGLEIQIEMNGKGEPYNPLIEYLI
ncbi:putative leucine--tRNA ligase, cytoplasmic [Cucumispora dikerogammari]|nr:putative leucine--tRNA ligase, cytoplasmic [Cucumispora dikerogammari]